MTSLAKIRRVGLCLVMTVLAAGHALAATTVGTLPRVASPNPTFCVERVAPGDLAVFSTITVPAADVGQAATMFLGAVIDNNLFLNDGNTFVLYTGGPLPAFQTAHTLSATERFLLVSSINAPEGVYQVGSGYQIGTGPIVFGAYTLKVTPQTGPLDVCAHPDQSQAASGDIPRAGGSVSATATDGTRFTLTLPANALLGNERITLTPVITVDGLPLSGGLVAAVQVGPEGLRLLAPATLTIEPAAPFDAQAVTGFSYHETGEEFHLYPLDVSGSRLSLQFMHFSGYGVGNGTAAERAAQQQRPPTAAEDRANQRSSEVLDDARRQGRALTPEDLTKLDQIYRDWLETSVDPNLTAAQNAVQNHAPNFDQLVDAAIAESTAWLQGVGKVGITGRFSRDVRANEPGPADDVRARRNTLNSASLLVALAGCIEGKQSLSAVAAMRYYGLAVTFGDILTEHNLSDRVRKCAKFKLEFFSTQTASLRNEFETVGFVTAAVPLTLNLDTISPQWLTFEGFGTTHYVSFSIKPASGCRFEGKQALGDSLFAVLAARFPLGIGSLLKLEVVMDPGLPTEGVSGNVLCPDRGTSASASGPFWLLGWFNFHAQEFKPCPVLFGFCVADWRVPGGEGLFATKEYPIKPEQAGDATLQEDTILDLIHTPEQ